MYSNIEEWVERHPKCCPNGHAWTTGAGTTLAGAFLPGWESGMVGGQPHVDLAQCHRVIHAEPGVSLLHRE